MRNADFELIYLGIHLAASKRKSYQESAIRYYQILTVFFQEKGLTTRQLLKLGERPDPEFKILRSDLTEEGYELFKDGYPKWARKVEKGMSPDDTTILESELAKIREDSN